MTVAVKNIIPRKQAENAQTAQYTALNCKTIIDKFTVTENGTVLYREVTRIMRDDEIVAQTFHRTSLYPGQDLTGQPAQVAAIAQVAWTPDVLAAYQDAQEKAATEAAARAAEAAAQVGNLSGVEA